MKFPALIIGDVHGKKKMLKELVQLLHFDIPAWVERYEIKSVVFVGDLFNRVDTLDLDTSVVFHRALHRLKVDYQVEAHLLAGNHDAHYKEDANTAGIMQERAHVLELFSEVAHVHTHQGCTVDAGVGVEWIPWCGHQHSGISVLSPDVPGVVFMHYPLRSVVEALRIEQYLGKETIFEGSCPNHLYVAGHIHCPFDKGNEHTVGVPYPTRDKPEEYYNRVLIMPDHKSVVSCPTNHGQYFRVEISSPEQLPGLKQELLNRLQSEGFMSAEPGDLRFKKTRLDLVSYNDALAPKDLAEFKKGTDWSVKYINKVITAADVPAQTELVAAHQATRSPLAVYTEYLHRHPITTHTPEQLLGLLREHGGFDKCA